MNTAVTAPDCGYQDHPHSVNMSSDPVSASDSSDNAMEEEENNNKKKRAIRSNEGGVRRPPGNLSSSTNAQQQQQQQQQQQEQEQQPDCSSSTQETEASSIAATLPPSQAEAVAAEKIPAMAVNSAPGAHHMDEGRVVVDQKKKATPRGVGERRAPAPAPKPPPSQVATPAVAAASPNAAMMGQATTIPAATDDAIAEAEGNKEVDDKYNTKEAPAGAVLDRAALEAAKIRAYGDTQTTTTTTTSASRRATSAGSATSAPIAVLSENMSSDNNDIEVGLIPDEINPPAVEQSLGADTGGEGDDEEEGEERVEPSLPSSRIPSSSPVEENQECAPDVITIPSSSPADGGQDDDEDTENPSRGPRAPPPPANVTSSTTSAPELPEAIPVPEPTTLRSGTSVGGVGGGGDSGGGGMAGSAVVQAQPLEEWGTSHDPDKKSIRNCLSPTQWAVGALLIVVLIVVGVVVGITQKSKDDNNDGSSDSGNGNSTTVSPSSAPPVTDTDPPSSCIPFDPFNEDLHFLTLQALKEPCSPQSKANSWMMQDPNLDAYEPKRKLQRFALATLYYSTSGEDWKNNDLWLDYDIDECQWYNQDADGKTTVCNGDSSIMHLNLARNNLDGVLPVELFFFPALATLDLSNNRLYGTAPTMFNGARYLERLVLSSNQLTGQFTAELGFVASKLAVLHNDDNMFTGAVPGLLRLLPHLSDLNITGNQYTGALPGSLIQLSDHLTSIQVSDNGITGEIPSELGAASKLQVIDVGGNPQLGGRIPTELAALTSLSILDISNTAVSGELPGELCSLQRGGVLDVLADCGGSFQCCVV